MTGKPNFLLFITDQHRADHLGCYGNGVVRTPNIDGIATAGTRFERFYVANPVCMPNRATLMTGRMPSAHGVRHNGIPLSLDHVTFVELLAAAGYDTALCGKAHLQNFTGRPPSYGLNTRPGLQAPPQGLSDARKSRRAGPAYEMENQTDWQPTALPFYGFNHAEICTGHGDQVGGDYLAWLAARGGDAARLVGPGNATPDPDRRAPQAWRTAVPEALYPTTYVAERACDYLARRAGKDTPFFLQVSFPDPHHPFTPPGRFWNMYDPAEIRLPENFSAGGLAPINAMREELRNGTAVRDQPTRPFAVTEDEAKVIIALTYGMITMVDEAVGRVYAALREAGHADDTVVIFTTDHGDFMGDFGLMTKYLLHYQALIRVPLIVHDPARAAAAATRGDLAGSIDLAPTILARAGLSPFNGMQGRDLFDADVPAPTSMLVEEDGVLPMFGEPVAERVRTLVTADRRLSLHQGPDWWELYDLASDPYEMRNLWDDPAARAEARPLVEELVRRMTALQDRSPLPSGRA